MPLINEWIFNYVLLSKVCLEKKYTTRGKNSVNCFRAQSFTSLMADLCQDISGGSAFSRCLNGTIP